MILKNLLQLVKTIIKLNLDTVNQNTLTVLVNLVSRQTDANPYGYHKQHATLELDAAQMQSIHQLK